MTTSAEAIDHCGSSTLDLLQRRLRGMFGQRGQHGSMVVETAVVLPVFFVLFIGFCQYSFALATYMNATYAARVGARYASLHSLSSDSPATQAQDEAYIQSLLFFPGASKPTVFVYYGDRSGSTSAVGNYQGDLVGVLVIWSQNINIPFFKNKTIYIATEAYRVIQR